METLITVVIWILITFAAMAVATFLAALIIAVSSALKGDEDRRAGKR